MSEPTDPMIELGKMKLPPRRRDHIGDTTEMIGVAKALIEVAEKVPAGMFTHDYRLTAIGRPYKPLILDDESKAFTDFLNYCSTHGPAIAEALVRRVEGDAQAHAYTLELARAVTRLTSERDALRDTNRELNRRCQAAEAALADAAKLNLSQFKGGNAGRALLAWRVGKLQDEVRLLRAAIEAGRNEICPPDEFCECGCGSDAFKVIDAALAAKEARRD